MWFDGVLESIGKGMADAGESCLEASMEVWKLASTKVLEYCTTNPTTFGSSWSTVAALYNSFMGIGAGLLTLYFVVGFLRESIDIRNNFTLENMFRFFMRLILTATLLSSTLSLIREFLGLSAALAGEVGASLTTGSVPGGLFDGIMTNLEGGAWIGYGFICFVGGLVGMFVVIISAFSILMAVIGRFFKIYLIIPFAPIALSSFAGGGGLSQSGASWIKTFFAYCLEIIVIALALLISFRMFGAQSGIFGNPTNLAEGVGGAVLGICEIVMPVVIAAASVKGAESTIRKCLGL